MLTGNSLFTIASYGDDEDEEADDDHLLALNDTLEPLPDAWLAKWPRASMYFGPRRERLYPEASEAEEGIGAGKDNTSERNGLNGDVAPDTTIFIADSLEVRFETEKPSEIDAEEAKQITTLIRRILQYEFSQRPTAAELLGDPWFKE